MSYIILMALGAMVLFGLVDFLLKKGVDLGINLYVLFFYTALIATAPFGILFFIQPGSQKIDIPLLGYSLAIGVLVFIAMLALLLALKVGDASIVVPIGRMGFVITAVFAFIFLGETLTVTKGLGILCAIIAIILLSKE